MGAVNASKTLTLWGVCVVHRQCPSRFMQHRSGEERDFSATANLKNGRSYVRGQCKFCLHFYLPSSVPVPNTKDFSFCANIVLPVVQIPERGSCVRSFRILKIWRPYEYCGIQIPF